MERTTDDLLRRITFDSFAGRFAAGSAPSYERFAMPSAF
jgi:hypothetical protein